MRTGRSRILTRRYCKAAPHAVARREFLIGAAALAWCGASQRATAQTGSRVVGLAAAPGRASIVGAPHPDTAVWCYDGQVPGPEIRARQGDRLRIEFTNQLSDDTTVHWHGIRLPNGMDGVPHLTQEPVPPGGTFVYEFELPDAGTFWFHPHSRSWEQVERGLAGALIVEEPTPVAVDRDVVWLLDDWRLQRDGSISPDFGSLQDTTHAGRIGNTPTVNGRLRETFALRAGERIRFRLINAANGRIFGLEFTGHRSKVVALDGHPVEPHDPADGRVVLGPGQRVDLIVDGVAEPDTRHPVTDRFYRGQEYRLIDLAYTAEPRLPDRYGEVAALASNPVSEPDLSTAHRFS
jgi:FtsP/CotA-like multicopper oxidase with cupredoxin domain